MKRKSRYWHVYPSGYQEFEVRCNLESFRVNLLNKTCTCRAWQVSGIPCPHSVAAIYHLHKNVDDFLSDNLKKTKFMAAYMYSIRPVGGELFGPKTNNPPPLPPMERRMPGRPSVKRKRSTTESSNAVRSTRSRKCQKCQQLGHYQSTCKNDAVQAPAKGTAKKGRPKKPDPSRNPKKSATTRTGVRYGPNGSRYVPISSLRGNRGEGSSEAGLVDVPVSDQPSNAPTGNGNLFNGLIILYEILSLMPIWFFCRCLFVIEGVRYHMDMYCNCDASRKGPNILTDHMVIRGPFKHIGEQFNIPRNSWLKLTLGEPARCHGTSAGYEIVFNVEKI
ncbi:hypothetical protein OSB04_032150 [Centaurea solstitialis]|uniref:SWIM-type domain-containing protein n=1 Tax=Centaurea solstitialis TaxID=347529 RepID=A0AA38VYA0_9ASTR|nr:hypothetical protein OSB04_032150 [Centaurea solstitialis]